MDSAPYIHPGQFYAELHNTRCPRCDSRRWNILTSCSRCEAACCDSPECGSSDGSKGDELTCATCAKKMVLEEQDEISAGYAEALNLCAVEAICSANSVGQMSTLLEQHLTECAECAAMIPVLKPIEIQVAQVTSPEWNHKEVA
jgi:hypothetical protein